jgi:hypothetical protein
VEANMVTDTGLIVVSIISVFGMVTLMFLSQHNYFKKKTFLHKLGQQKKIDKLKLSQLKKEMGVSENNRKTSDNNLDLNGIIGNILDNYKSEDGEEEEGGMIENILGTVVENNPELVQRVLGGISGKKQDEEEQQEIKFLGEE